MGILKQQYDTQMARCLHEKVVKTKRWNQSEQCWDDEYTCQVCGLIE